MTRVRSSLVAALAVVLTVLVAPPPAQAAVPSYVALGDSYASGTGTRSYIADGTSCQRSTYAYPSLIAAASGYALNFRACSGARIADVTDTQLSALTATTSYVRSRSAATTPGSPTCSPRARCRRGRPTATARSTAPRATSAARCPPSWPRCTPRSAPAHRARSWWSSATHASSTARTAAPSPGSAPAEETKLNATADLLNATTAAQASAAASVRRPDDALHRARVVRQPGVDQRPLLPDLRGLPPQPFRARLGLHPHRQPAADRRRRHGHPLGAGGGPRRGRRAGRAPTDVRRRRLPHRTGVVPAARPPLRRGSQGRRAARHRPRPVARPPGPVSVRRTVRRCCLPGRRRPVATPQPTRCCRRRRP